MSKRKNQYITTSDDYVRPHKKSKTSYHSTRSNSNCSNSNCSNSNCSNSNCTADMDVSSTNVTPVSTKSNFFSTYAVRVYSRTHPICQHHINASTY